MCNKYRGARTSAPIYHAAITTVSLLFTGNERLMFYVLIINFINFIVAFIGSLVSGAVLSYLVLMVTLMLPGLHRLVN